MFRYRVRLDGTKTRELPAILRAFAWWLARQPHGVVGDFEIEVMPAKVLPNALAFALLPGNQRLIVNLHDGSIWVATTTNKKRMIAISTREFLIGLARGDTGVLALDSSNLLPRRELKIWLKLRSARSPRRGVGERARSRNN